MSAGMKPCPFPDSFCIPSLYWDVQIQL